MAADVGENLQIECQSVPMSGAGPSYRQPGRPAWATPLDDKTSRAIRYPMALPSPQLYQIRCGPKTKKVTIPIIPDLNAGR
ncbi:hypothetical protein FHS76_003660 [Ochrobactrum daejeonense]|uniref:Uncharacterized protein n=1 Tax=Brucella daejeonensis TaxID=659015 RepID=A0A7W9B024_9HYPH|nr:hypothetical protein [Brucella daejeonensis]MBB5703750.1 hypothetical protein [Brucella daejeonensis]NKB78744.1 hypothetical protein [Brucella daejeonensis]